MVNFNKLVFLLICIFFVCTISQISYAKDGLIEYTKEYKDWLKLSAEEREKIPIIKFSTSFFVKDKIENEAWSDSDNMVPFEFSKIFGKSIYSSYFNLADKIDIKVENQRKTQECWALSLLSSMQTNLLYKQNKILDFSERHMDYATSNSFIDLIGENNIYDRSVKMGSIPQVGLSYLTNGLGAVLEEEMPFKNDIESISKKEIEIEPSYYVKDYIEIPGIKKEYINDGTILYYDLYGNQYDLDDVAEIRKQIKRYLVNNGAIFAVTAFQYTEGFENPNNRAKSTNYCCRYSGVERDHGITIVGWDDNYSFSNFNEKNRPTSNGAYIALQTFGDASYNNGYIYISYEDALIETILFGISSSQKYDYDNLYQNDFYGPNLTVNANDYQDGYYSEVFSRKNLESEYLKSISVSIPQKSKIDIWINPKNDKLNDSLIYAGGSSTFLESGYHTIDVNPIELLGDEFTVIIKQVPESGNLKFNVEAKANNDIYKNVSSLNNKNKISKDGKNWILLKDLSENADEIKMLSTADLCIKCFTKKD